MGGRLFQSPRWRATGANLAQDGGRGPQGGMNVIEQCPLANDS